MSSKGFLTSDSFACSPAEIEKLQMLAQDPRPMQEKQAVLAQVSLVQRCFMSGPPLSCTHT